MNDCESASLNLKSIAAVLLSERCPSQVSITLGLGPNVFHFDLNGVATRR